MTDDEVSECLAWEQHNQLSAKPNIHRLFTVQWLTRMFSEPLWYHVFVQALPEYDTGTNTLLCWSWGLLSLTLTSLGVYCPIVTSTNPAANIGLCMFNSVNIRVVFQSGMDYILVYSECFYILLSSLHILSVLVFCFIYIPNIVFLQTVYVPFTLSFCTLYFTKLSLSFPHIALITCSLTFPSDTIMVDLRASWASYSEFWFQYMIATGTLDWDIRGLLDLWCLLWTLVNLWKHRLLLPKLYKWQRKVRLTKFFSLHMSLRWAENSVRPFSAHSNWQQALIWSQAC